MRKLSHSLQLLGSLALLFALSACKDNRSRPATPTPQTPLRAQAPTRTGTRTGTQPKSPAQPKFRNVNAKQAHALLQGRQPVVVLDVRTAGEFSQGHIAGAHNIDIGSKEFQQRIQKLDRRKTYLVHCAAGVPSGRSDRAFQLLKKLGFQKIYHLDGGFMAWQRAKNPVTTNKKSQ